MSLQLWVGGEEEAIALQLQQSLQEDLWWASILRSVGISSHSCSMLSNRTECLVRASPFLPSCAGVKGSQARARLQVTVEYQSAAWVPLVLALFLFVSAPAASRSLLCYYSTGALLSSVLCVGVAMFWLCRRVMSPRKAVFVGVLSWGGTLFQGMAHNLIFNKWSALFIATSGLIGFLLAYNNPPSHRMQFSVQLLFQFLSVVTVVLSAPSAWREGAATLGAMAAAHTVLLLRAPRHPRLRQTEEEEEEEEVGEQEEEAVSHSLFSTPLKALRASSKTPKKRMTEKHYIEQNYSGPKKAQVLRDNPFHCKGAPEYMSEDSYHKQTLDCTREAEAALMDFYRREGMERTAHLLSPAARSKIMQLLGDQRLPRDEEDDDDDADFSD